MPQDEITDGRRFHRAEDRRRARLALVLGSGLGSLADELKEASPSPMPKSRASPSRRRRVTPAASSRAASRAGESSSCRARFHCYEGYPASRIAFPIRVFRKLGVERLFLTNAAGGANPGFSPGDLMLITDHINLTGQNPCIGENDPLIGPRFFDMSHAYDPELRAAARRAAAELGMGLREGVYAWFSGPSFETPAEIRMARTLGADAVGMSTVPEAIAAAHCGLRVARSILHHQPGRGHERQAHHVGGGPRDIGAREAPLLGLRQAYDFVHRLKGSVI